MSARLRVSLAVLILMMITIASLLADSQTDRSALPAHISGTTLSIWSDEDLANYANHGSGTEADPYVIDSAPPAGPYSQIYISNTRSHLVITGLYVYGAEEQWSPFGFELANVSDVEIDGCFLYNLTLSAFTFDNLRISNSRLDRSSIEFGQGWVMGSNLHGNSHATVSGNQITASKWSGISAENCDNLTIAYNTIVGSGSLGLAISRSNNVLVTDNNLTENEQGLYVGDSADVTIVANEIAYSNSTGIVLDTGSSVLMHHNNIVNNTMRIDYGYYQSLSHFPRINLSLGYPYGGNYWSNNTAPDLFEGPGQNQSGSDGIADQPMILLRGVDQYPLMEPFRRVHDSLPPLARINVLPHVAKPNSTFTLDASSSWDSEDAAVDMQFRWDFTNDGSWDTPWLSTTSITYTFQAQSNGTVRLIVKDMNGLENETTCPLLVDAHAPVITTDFGSRTKKFTHDTVSINWTCQEEFSGLEKTGDSFHDTGYFRILINGVELRDHSPGTGYWMVSSASGYLGAVYNASSNLTLEGLPDGKYVVMIQAQDIAGNVAQIEIAFEVHTNPLNPSGPYGVWPFAIFLTGLAAVVVVIFYLAFRPKGKLPEISPSPEAEKPLSEIHK